MHYIILTGLVHSRWRRVAMHVGIASVLGFVTTFSGAVYGTEQVSSATAQAGSSFSLRLLDAKTGGPIQEETAYPYAELILCDEETFECPEINGVAAGSADEEGRINRLDTDFYGEPISSGLYQIRAAANGYEVEKIGPFILGENEHIDFGDVLLVPEPPAPPSQISITEVKACESVSPKGGRCLYRIRIKNNTETKFRGLTWSLVNNFGTFNPDSFSIFEADSASRKKSGRRQPVWLYPNGSRIVQFQFKLPENAIVGAQFCPSLYVGQQPYPLNNAVAEKLLFCLTKDPDGSYSTFTYP